jgi:hypothetical protein
MRLDHIPPATVRFWAWVDSSVTWVLALPPAAQGFIALLYRINGWLGGAAAPPPFAPIQLFFVCLSGVLISLWVAVRLIWPLGALAYADAWGRIAVSALIFYFLACTDAPGVLAFFIFTEMAGAIAQLRAAHRFPRT